ncbi:MAG: hydrogenase maturation protease [Burkholderiales bacterium]|nr:hydrogenase maturation protease [Burkholderiales bacterium]
MNVLVLAWGNPSRGDDALGPEFARRIAALANGLPGVEVLTDFQLAPEHATDLAGRDLVLFADARLGMARPLAFARVSPARDASFSSHAMSPGALLAAYEAAFRRAAPPAWILAMRGERFELGEPLGAAAQQSLAAAVAFAESLLRDARPARWDAAATVAD